jgi:hypothetical protein
LIERIEKLRGEGLPAREAMLEAAIGRAQELLGQEKTMPADIRNYLLADFLKKAVGAGLIERDRVRWGRDGVIYATFRGKEGLKEYRYDSEKNFFK